MLPIYDYDKMFNLILETGIIPQNWSKGVIIPIYKKKGDPTSPNNYCPITLLFCVSKLFTSVLNARLNKFLDENNIKQDFENITAPQITYLLYTLLLKFSVTTKRKYSVHILISVKPLTQSGV